MYDRGDFHPGRRRFAGRPARGYDQYDDGYRGSRGPSGPRGNAPRQQSPGYGGDYWLLGEREFIRQGYRDRYDEAYRRFDARNQPRYSPVGGMYGGAGTYRGGRDLPRPIRENTRFSDWTRWF